MLKSLSVVAVAHMKSFAVFNKCAVQIFLYALTVTRMEIFLCCFWSLTDYQWDGDFSRANRQMHKGNTSKDLS